MVMHWTYNIPYYDYYRLVIYPHVAFIRISKLKILVYLYQCVVTAHHNRYVPGMDLNVDMQTETHSLHELEVNSRFNDTFQQFPWKISSTSMQANLLPTNTWIYCRGSCSSLKGICLLRILDQISYCPMTAWYLDHAAGPPLGTQLPPARYRM